MRGKGEKTQRPLLCLHGSFGFLGELLCAGCLRGKDEAKQGFGVLFALPTPAVVNGCGYVELYGEAGSGTWSQKSPNGIGDRRDGCADGTAGWRDCR